MACLRPDPLKRFPWGIPWYEPAELDEMFGALGTAMFSKRHASSDPYLLSTEDLTVLVEDQDVDLDIGFDFDDSEFGVLGKTIFRRSETIVRISRRIALNRSLENLYRMTLAHEFAHVVLHRQLYEPYFDESAEAEEVFKGETLIDRDPSEDPLEWQARRAAGAVLIPTSVLARIAPANWCPVAKGSRNAAGLTNLVAKRFMTSYAAATVRLEQLGYIQEPKFGRAGYGLEHSSSIFERMVSSRS